jgi:hypothetical protein
MARDRTAMAAGTMRGRWRRFSPGSIRARPTARISVVAPQWINWPRSGLAARRISPRWKSAASRATWRAIATAATRACIPTRCRGVRPPSRCPRR